MKTINLSVDETTWRAARRVAAEHDTSVSAIVRNYLDALAKGAACLVAAKGEDKERRDRERLVRLFREANLVLGYKPSREKTYER